MERASVIQKAKLAEQAEGYEDMAAFMKRGVGKGGGGDDGKRSRKGGQGVGEGCRDFTEEGQEASPCR